MHPGNRQPVPGDADEAHEALVARLDRRFERPALAEGGLPLDGVDEVVQLDQVEVVDPETLERAADLLARGCALALAGLRCEEDRSRWRASQGASLSSESPYDAAVSM